jgi:hypothetical protein
VRLRRSFRPSAAAQRCARATLDTFDSPQLARTIVTRPKSRASTHSSPPACRRRSGPRPGRALPAGRGCHFEQPDPHADSRGLRDPRRPRRLWGSSPRPPARTIDSSYSTRLRVAAWGSGCRPDKLGGLLCYRARTFVRRWGTGGVRVLVPLISYRTRVRYHVS